MRILMITDFYHPFVGGVEQHVRSLGHKLYARGHDVAVATLQGAGTDAFEVDQGVRVYRIAGTLQRADWLFEQRHRRWAPPFPDPEATLGLRRVVAAERPEIVHGHDWFARSFIPLKRRSRAKFVMSLHYYTLSCAKKNLMHRDAPCSGPGLAKCLSCATEHYGAAKGIPVTLSNFALSAAERKSVDMYLPVSRATAVGNGLVGSKLPYQIVPNFVQDGAGTPHTDTSDYVAQLPAGDFLLFVGDFQHYKGFDVLLRAYGGLENPPPLVLIGKSGKDLPKNLPRGAVLLTTWPNHAVMEAWRRSTIAIVPSVWPEPFGIVVIEAMASGRPVVASNVGGISDIVVDGETGLLVPPGDAGALQHALQRLLADPELRARMGQAGSRRVALFRTDAVVPCIEQVYADLLTSSQPGAHQAKRQPASVEQGGMPSSK